MTPAPYLAFILAVLTPAPTASTDAPRSPRHIKLGAFSIPEILPAVRELQAAEDAHEKEVTIDLDSPGGSIGVGLAFIGMVRAAHQGGMMVTCVVPAMGKAASMGSIFFEVACDKRIMESGASLLFHEPRVSEFSGTAEELRREADSLDDSNRRIAIMIASRLTHANGSHWTPDEYIAWIKERDRWLSPEEARAIGAAD